MFSWEMFGEERDLAVSGNSEYGGGGPNVAAAVVVVVVVTVEELRGCTTGGADGVKRKGPLGKAAVEVEDARLRGWVVVLWPDDGAGAGARLRTVGVMLLRGG
jgi:hypothetical protein